MAVTKVPDSTPGIVMMHALGDEQELLAKLRYNHLIAIFTGIPCYSLQNHLRAIVPIFGQVETDELYVGIDRYGSHYIFPIRAKRKRRRLTISQVEQDIALCKVKFPKLICRPIAAQVMEDEHIALFEFTQSGQGVGLISERHFRLVPPRDMV